MEKNTNSAPEWLPDWRNPDEYPDTATTSKTQWAWEFLRRNPDYQEYYSSLRSSSPGDHVAKIRDPKPQSPPPDFQIHHPVDPSTPSEDPHSGAWFPFQQMPSFRPYVDLESLGEGWHKIPFEQHHPWEYVVMFDLRYPIKRQLKLAKHVMNRHVKMGHTGAKLIRWKARTDVYKEYLRILDAEARGVTQAEMAKVLFPENLEREKLVQRKLQAARKMCSVGYRYLAHEDVVDKQCRDIDSGRFD